MPLMRITCFCLVSSEDSWCCREEASASEALLKEEAIILYLEEITAYCCKLLYLFI